MRGAISRSITFDTAVVSSLCLVRTGLVRLGPVYIEAQAGKKIIRAVDLAAILKRPTPSGWTLEASDGDGTITVPGYAADILEGFRRSSSTSTMRANPFE